MYLCGGACLCVWKCTINRIRLEVGEKDSADTVDDRRKEERCKN